MWLTLEQLETDSLWTGLWSVRLLKRLSFGMSYCRPHSASNRTATTDRHNITSTLATERWAQSWSRCRGSQPSRDFLSHPPALCCHYFMPRMPSPSQLKNVTVLQPVPSYTASRQRHIVWTTCPKLLRSFVPVGIEPTTYQSHVQCLTATLLHHLHLTHLGQVDQRSLRIFHTETAVWLLTNHNTHKVNRVL